MNYKGGISLPRKYNCVLCKKEFISIRNNRTPKYCSRQCSGRKSYIERKTIICLQCGKEHKCKHIKAKNLFCSQGCSMKHTGKLNKNRKKNYCGEKNHAWKGGITSETNKIRMGLDYKMWRDKVFTRDNYTCLECGRRGGDGKKIILNADHIKPFALFPELRLDINNGKTLCLECHKKTPTFGGKIHKIKNELST